MPNYIEIIGEFYPSAEVYLNMPGGDPTNYSDVIWITTTISQADLDAHAANVGTSSEEMLQGPIAGIQNNELLRFSDSDNLFHAVDHLTSLKDSFTTKNDDDLIYYDQATDSFKLINPKTLIGDNYGATVDFCASGSNKNKFINSSITNASSVNSTFVAPSDGEIIAVAISTKSNSDTNWYLQIILNATKDGSGTFSGGTQIGADIEKPTGTLDHSVESLTGYSFSKNDRIAAYIKGGNQGGGKAWEPAITLYVRYN